MQPEITYQPDSATGNLFIENLPVSTDNNLRLERSVIHSTDIPTSPQTTEIQETAKETQVRSALSASAQLRQSWWQRERNLLVDGSRYMEPRADALATLVMVSPQPELQLPQRLIQQVNYDWLTVVLLLSVAIFATIRTSWNKYMVNLFLSVTNYSTSNRMYQEKNTSLRQGSFLLDVLFYLTFSAFLFQVLNYFRLDFPFRNFYLYLISFGVVLGYFFFKKAIYRIMGFILERKTETIEYLFHAGSFKRVAGLVLLPVVAIIAFFPFGNLQIPVIAGLIVVSLLYFLLILRGFIVLLKKQFSIFYLFLYFCTLEILPLVLLYRILVK
jgi:hypothetical protein